MKTNKNNIIELTNNELPFITGATCDCFCKTSGKVEPYKLLESTTKFRSMYACEKFCEKHGLIFLDCLGNDDNFDFSKDLSLTQIISESKK